MEGDADIAVAASLMADSSRAAALVELMDGRALPAGELAAVAGVSRATMSEHLSKLRLARYVTEERGGRHRYFRLAGPEVAAAVEALSALAPRRDVRSLRQANSAEALGAARTCYSHLAGRLGVGLTEALLAGELIERDEDVFLITAAGTEKLSDLGMAPVPRTGKTCNDWSERRPHLAGRLGVALARHLFDLDWLRRTDRAREVKVTASGRDGLARELSFDLPV